MNRVEQIIFSKRDFLVFFGHPAFRKKGTIPANSKIDAAIKIR